MMFSVGPWELAIVLSKVLSYAGLVSLSGGIFVLWLGSFVQPASLSRNNQLLEGESRTGSAPTMGWSVQTRLRLINVLLLACAVGALAVVLFYLLQVGVINQMGVTGMFDATMIGLLVQSSVGYGSGLKLGGFVVAGVSVLLCRSTLLSSQRRLPLLLICGWLLATVLIATSFALLGHIAELSLLPRLAIIGHIVVIGLWAGALYPLHLLAGTEEATRVHPLMRLFGMAGWVIIAGLLVTGVTLVLQVLGSASELFTTPYGLQLLFKLALVAGLLCLAALNKFRLVPALPAAGGGSLRRSITAEMVLVFIILLVTACMTTITGPAHLM